MSSYLALLIGLALLGGAPQDQQDTSPSDLPSVHDQIEEAAGTDCCSGAEGCGPCGHGCAKGAHPCCDPCGGHRGCLADAYHMCLRPLFHGDCDMVPHYHYLPELHGYYYLRPYHFTHVQRHQEFVSSYGGDPRAPYANTLFQQIYQQMSNSDAQGKQGMGYRASPSRTPALELIPTAGSKRSWGIVRPARFLGRGIKPEAK